MLTMSAAAQAAVRRSWVMHTRVESWRGATLLDGDVPISSGRHETDTALRIPDQVTLTVPRVDRGVSWDPTADQEHPLAPWGQRLRISVGVELAHAQVEWICRGWHLITDARVDGDAVRVTASSLLTWIDEARLTAPLQPSGTIVSTLRHLIEPALTADVRSAPPDRPIPADLSWDEDRLAALLELLDAWPATAVVDPSGALVVGVPTVTAAAVWDLSTAAGGTVVDVGTTATRDGAATCVVARGTDADGNPVQGVALDTSGGPLDAAGPYNPLVVPYFHSSPLLTSMSECVAAAETILARRRAQAARRVTITAVPCPALQAGDTVTIDAPDLLGVVERITMPLTPSDGQMDAEVRVHG